MEKLSELSKPVAYSLRFRNMNGEPDKTINANTTFSTLEKAKAYGLGNRYVTQDDGKIVCVRDPSQDPIVEPLYSQEYVSALLAELEFEKHNNAGVAGMVEDYETKLEAKSLECRGIEQERELFRIERAAHQQHAQELDKRIAELEKKLEESRETTLLVRDEWQKDKERADEAEKRLATPVRLPETYSPDPWMSSDPDGTWLDKEDAKGSIRAAGFTVEGDE